MNLLEKLLKIRKEVEYFQKTVSGQQGMYVDSAVLLKTIRDKMDELKILLVPTILSGAQVECIAFPSKSNPNAKAFVFAGDMAFQWINGEDSKDTVIVPWFLTGKNAQDPAMAYGSALTYTERYFILKFFQIPTAKDDPDAFEEKTREKEKAELLPNTEWWNNAILAIQGGVDIAGIKKSAVLSAENEKLLLAEAKNVS